MRKKFFFRNRIFAMGSMFSHSRFIMYLQDATGKFVPIEYPTTLCNLKQYLLQHYEYEANTLLVQESSTHIMHISTENSYRALVPKHKMVEPNVHIYYVIVELPFAF